MKIKIIKKYKQSTVESCLACCLLNLIAPEKTPTKKQEFSLLISALKFTREDFVTGHLGYIKRKYKKGLIRYVHNEFLYNDLKKIKCKERIIQRKIDISFIDKLLSNNPIIISLDAYQFDKFYHYPHWILVYKKVGKGYLIYEPWEGKAKYMPENKLKESLKSYLQRLWMAPQIITQNL